VEVAWRRHNDGIDVVTIENLAVIGERWGVVAPQHSLRAIPGLWIDIADGRDFHAGLLKHLRYEICTAHTDPDESGTNLPLLSREYPRGAKGRD
jgi:hypothetical protein